jgi:cytochrome c oxidase subunit 3
MGEPRIAEPELAEPYADLRHQRQTANLGVWAFLSTEVLFFSALLTAYSVYRFLYPQGFAEAGRHTEVLLGSINTGVLLTSSLFMALAVHAIEAGARRLMMLFLLITALLGIAFLGIKAVEYSKEIGEGLFPGALFTYAGPYTHPVELFFFIYFLATGIHALHLTIGIGALFFLMWRARRGSFTAEYHAGVEGVGLYWHFVDAVWVFIFPLIYLLGRNT